MQLRLGRDLPDDPGAGRAVAEFVRALDHVAVILVAAERAQFVGRQALIEPVDLLVDTGIQNGDPDALPVTGLHGMVKFLKFKERAHRCLASRRVAINRSLKQSRPGVPSAHG